MCNLSEYIRKQGYDEGFAEGFAEGEHRVETLFRKLFAEDRIEDAKRAAEDRDYYEKLMREFSIDYEVS